MNEFFGFRAEKDTCVCQDDAVKYLQKHHFHQKKNTGISKARRQQKEEENSGL